MKRTNLVLDPQLLQEAFTVLGAGTYSETVNIALAEAIRVAKIRGIQRWFGSGIWEGDLAEMRGLPVARKRQSRAKN